jgi:hypothetical protein
MRAAGSAVLNRTRGVTSPTSSIRTERARATSPIGTGGGQDQPPPKGLGDDGDQLRMD